MKVLVSSTSFIVKESIASIFSRIYKDSQVLIVNGIDKIEEFDKYDILFIHISGKEYEDLSNIMELKSRCNKVIILDPFKNSKILKLCIGGKLDGYVTDFEDEYEIKYIIGKIVSGSKFYDSDVVDMVMGSKRLNTENVLTRREEDVINEVTKGLTNRDIANKLEVTEFTVKKHISNVLEKLNLRSRKDIIIHFNNK